MYAEKVGGSLWVKIAIIPKVPGTIKVGVSEGQTIVVGTWYPKWWMFVPKSKFLFVPGTLRDDS